ncbi:hypothetical protein Cs7R123_17300 [Catellatospora sp. TT07R-123]|uniref:hypothetical protein n=1 Tax=Catellatospora sp. TT07R-123 TaxID=2733863 RepID=UPI001B2E66FA|nr:hypothetical protein [Catellatospora sp. TT07R-123]GHJ44388.1 hypothetical protein Cs7R123_17300 [Catellatospora sp. TT07R-123]
MTDLLAQIQASPWLADLLAQRFDFDLTRTDPVEQVHLAGGVPLTPIAGDSAGGTFLLTPSGAVVYAGSEGEGGLIAHDLRDALALVVGVANLHDALSLPPGEDLLRALAELDEEIRQDDALDPGGQTLDEARAQARQALDLPPVEGLLAALHAAADDDSFRPISEHGPYETMLS